MQVLLWLHILGAATWLGAAASVLFGGGAFASEGAPQQAAWYRFVERKSKLLISPAAILLLVTGVLLVTGNEAYGFGSTFVSIGFLAIIVGSGLGMGFYGPKSREAAAALDNGDGPTAAPIIARIRNFGAAEMGLLIVTVAAMVWKW